MAGATPKDTMSDRLSYSLPNALSVLVQRATRPSNPSKNIATNTAAPAQLEFQVDGGHDRVEAGEQCPSGEQVRQPVHSARPRCAIVVVTHAPP